MSPIDARIPLMTRTPHIQSPMDAYSRALAVRGQVQQNRNLTTYGTGLEQQNAEREREAKTAQAYSDLMRRNTKIDKDGTVTVNSGAVRKGLIDFGFPDIAQKYEEGRLKNAKDLADKNFAELKEDREKGEMIGRWAGMVVDAFKANPEDGPKAYALALNEAKQSPLDLSFLPPEFSEDIIPELEMFRWSALEGKEQLDEARKKLEAKEKKNSPKTTEDWLGLASRTMGQLKKQPGWMVQRNFLKAKGMPEDVLALIPETFSPEAAEQVARGGLTPFQQQPGQLRAAMTRQEGVAYRALLENKGVQVSGLSDEVIDEMLTPAQKQQAIEEHSIAIGSRTPKTDTSKEDGVKAAKAYSAYLSQVNKHRRDMEKEIQELMDQEMSDWVTVSKTGRGIALARKYSKLFKAAAAEYQAITGGEPPQEPSQQQGPGTQPASGGTRKRYNPRTRKLETY